MRHRRELARRFYTLGEEKQRILEALRREPGLDAWTLRDRVGLEQGALAYHLRFLEDRGLVRTTVVGRRRAYDAVPDASDEALDRFSAEFSPVRARIMKAVRERPGMSVGGVATAMGLPVATTDQHVRTLVSMGLLVAEGNLRVLRLGRAARRLPDAFQPRLHCVVPKEFPKLPGFRTILPVWVAAPPALSSRVAAFDLCVASSPRAAELRVLARAAHAEEPSRNGATATWIRAFRDLDLTAGDRSALVGLLVALTTPRPRFLPESAPAERLRGWSRRVERLGPGPVPEEARAELRSVNFAAAEAVEVARWLEECRVLPARTYQVVLQEAAQALAAWGRFGLAVTLLRAQADPALAPWVNFVEASLRASHGEDPSHELQKALTHPRPVWVPAPSVRALVDAWPRDWIVPLAENFALCHPFNAEAAGVVFYAAARELAFLDQREDARRILAFVDRAALARHDPEEAARVDELRHVLLRAEAEARREKGRAHGGGVGDGPAPRRRGFPSQ